MELNNLLLFILGQLIAGAAIWGGIRRDLQNIHRTIEGNKTDALAGINEAKRMADEAHQRIDRHLEKK